MRNMLINVWIGGILRSKDVEEGELLRPGYTGNPLYFLPGAESTLQQLHRASASAYDICEQFLEGQTAKSHITRLSSAFSFL